MMVDFVWCSPVIEIVSEDMLHICKMDYIKDFSRDFKLGQLGPGVVVEKSPLTLRHLGQKC